MFWWKLDILLVAITALFSWLFQQRRPKNGTKSSKQLENSPPNQTCLNIFCFFRDIFHSRRKMPNKQSKFICWRHVVFGSSKKGAFWQAAGGQLAKCWPRRSFFSSFWPKTKFLCIFHWNWWMFATFIFFQVFLFEPKKHGIFLDFSSSSIDGGFVWGNFETNLRLWAIRKPPGPRVL